MNLPAAGDAARSGELYPSVILHGDTLERRLEAAVGLARVLLCEAPAPERPCGGCRHCRRIAPPGDDAPFHPDFHCLERDLKTATSVDATKRFLRPAYLTPFEARGQVFVLAHAETLTQEAANALLKILEEPPGVTPRHFFLVASSSRELLATLRSRSLAVYLGGERGLDEDAVEELAGELATSLASYQKSGASVYQLMTAAALLRVGGFEDPRSTRPWMLGAAALVRVARGEAPLSGELRRGLLDLAEELLNATRWRVRGIPAPRIVEGLTCRHLGPARRPTT